MNIAHRGFSSTYPENTLLAFRKALELGVRWLEFDLHVTRDDELVVMHDHTVDRTTDGTGAVSALTLGEVKRLDAGSWRGPQFAGERVPTFCETLDALGSEARMVVELKFEGNLAVSRVVELLRERSAIGQAVVSSFDLAKLPETRSLAPELPTTALVRLGDRAPAALVSEVVETGADTLGIWCRDVTRELVESAREAGLSVRAWGLGQDQGTEMVRLIQAGVDGMTTDCPDVLQAILKRRGLA